MRVLLRRRTQVEQKSSCNTGVHVYIDGIATQDRRGFAMIRFKLVKTVDGGTVLVRVKEKSAFKSGGMVESGEA